MRWVLLLLLASCTSYGDTGATLPKCAAVSPQAEGRIAGEADKRGYDVVACTRRCDAGEVHTCTWERQANGERSAWLCNGSCWQVKESVSGDR